MRENERVIYRISRAECRRRAARPIRRRPGRARRLGYFRFRRI